MNLKIKSYIIYLVFLLFVAMILFSGCAKKSVKATEGKGINKVVENGVGKAKKFDDALDLAFRDALKKVVVTIIGEENEKKNSARLNSYMYGIAETYIIDYDVTDKVKEGKSTIVYIRATFNKSKVEESIETIGINIPGKKIKKDYAESPFAPIINEALDNLTYLVYFEPEKKRIKDEYARLSVNRINNYLANQEYEWVDPGRINEIKKEYLKVYEETQGSVSVVQLIAQALNADVYIVVDGIVEDEGKEGDVYFASASIDLKAFESATGRGLGTETGYSGKLGLASGKDAARRKCVEVAVGKAIPQVIELSRNYMTKAFEKGIRYEIVVQGVSSYKLLRGFTDAMKDTENFRSMKEISASEGQARYYVYYMGRKTELIDDIMDNIHQKEGFENLNVIVSRGNAVIFGIEE